jgi:hypothetical protein
MSRAERLMWGFFVFAYSFGVISLGASIWPVMQ